MISAPKLLTLAVAAFVSVGVNAAPCKPVSLSSSSSSEVVTPTSTPSETTPISTPSEITPTSTPSDTTPTSNTTPTSTPSNTPSVTPSTTPTTTPYTTPSTTPSATPVATTGIKNGGFDTPDAQGNHATPWIISYEADNSPDEGVEIVHDAANAASGEYYARLYFEHDVYHMTQLNQTLHGLDTSRLYRLTYTYRFVRAPAADSTGNANGFDNYTGMRCFIEGFVDDVQISSLELPLEPTTTQWQTHSDTFHVAAADPLLTVRMRCKAYNSNGFYVDWNIRQDSELWLDDILITAA